MDNQSQKPSSTAKWIAIAIIIASLIISGSILYSNSKKEDVVSNNQNQPTNNQPNPSGSVKVSIDDDAVLGDKNAPLTMIEFSDYECPFCKRHFSQVYPEIKKNYIDTGKLKLISRDFIAVPSHNPLATSEAMAAECAKDQLGDSSYYKFHSEIFTKTTSNGNGLTLSDLSLMAKNNGLNINKFQECLDSNKFKDEIEKDIAYARTIGVSGTPTFFIGKSTNNGIIDGTKIVGAQPYSAFKTVIDGLLSK